MHQFESENQELFTLEDFHKNINFTNRNISNETELSTNLTYEKIKSYQRYILKKEKFYL